MQKARFYIQALALFLLHASWGPTFRICNPVLSCHSCAVSWFICPIGVLVHFNGWALMPFIALGSMLLVGALAGRILCGWICPFGFLQDLLHKIPSRKFDLPAWTRNIKYVLLLLTVFLLPNVLGENTAFSFCRICPASALEVTVPDMIAGNAGAFTTGTAVKLGIAAAVLLLVVFSRRAFCSTMCPIGAFLAPLNHLSFWSVKVPTRDCISCKRCDRTCPTGVNPSARIEVGESPSRSLDCVVCHECQPVCPVKGKTPGSSGKEE